MTKKIFVIQQRHKVILLSLLCFLTYACSYIGRLNYSAALTEILAGNILTKTQGGMISTIYFAAYGAGQLVNGALADRHDPAKQMAVGIGGSAVLNLLFSRCTAYSGMLVIWGLNGYFQALIWAPAFLLLSTAVEERFRMKALLLLNTAPSAGTILAYLFSSVVLWRHWWDALFMGASLILATCAVLWYVGYKRIVQGADVCEVVIQEKKKDVSCGKDTLPALLLVSGAVMLIVPAMIHGMLKDGVTAWVPTYLTEMFSLPAKIAVAVTIVLPLINTMGAAMTYWLLRKIPNETSTAAVLFCTSGGCLLVLQLFGKASALLSVVLLAVVTAAMVGVNVLFCSEVPRRFSEMGRSATVSGFFNACGYIGAAASMYGIAVFSQKFGWTATQLAWIVSCVIAALFCAVVRSAWMAFRRKN